MCVCVWVEKRRGGVYLTTSETESEFPQLRLCVSVLLQGFCRTLRPVGMTQAYQCEARLPVGYLYTWGFDEELLWLRP